MSVLVTGANGFLGAHVVRSLRRSGRAVKAMVRPAARVEGLWDAGVEVARGDLRQRRGLEKVFDGVDTLMHLAACVGGDEDAHFAATVVGTENLLEAMAGSECRRVILCSTFSMYDWTRARGSLDENAPLWDAKALYKQDGYTIAKTWQERLVRRVCAERGWALTVLRPGAIWSGAATHQPNTGMRVGPFNLLFGPMSPMRLTYVENCADAFAAAMDARTVGHTYNVIDGQRVNVWDYARSRSKRAGGGGIPIPVPYSHARLAATIAAWVSRNIYREYGGKLPGILTPARFDAGFKGVRFPNDALRRDTGWRPRPFEECLRLAYTPAPAASAPASAPAAGRASSATGAAA